MQLTLQELIEYIDKNEEKFFNATLIKSTLECIGYIEDNIDKVAEDLRLKRYPSPADAAGRTFRVNDDPNKMAFHLNDFANSPEAFKTSYQYFFEEFYELIDYLKTLDDIFLQIFLKNIRQSDVGCMEARVNSAMAFARLVKKFDGKLPLDSLIGMFNEHLIGNNLKNKPDDVILIEALKYLEMYVDFEFPVIVNNELTPLTWDIVRDHLENSHGLDLHWDELEASDKLPRPYALRSVFRHHKQYHQLNFVTEGEAKLYLAYIRTVLSLQENPYLKYVVPKKNSDNTYRFLLTDEQFGRFLLATNIVNIKEEEKAAPQLTGACPIPTEGMFIKSIRADERCFVRQTGLSITQSLILQIKYTLRSAKKEFTTFASGIIRRAHKMPKYTAEEKFGFSQIQSATRVLPDVLPPVFGHNTNRNEILVGIRIDNKDALPSRLYVQDRNTVMRPYDHDTREEAKQYHAKVTDPLSQTLFDDMANFDAALRKPENAGRYNEAMMRMRWNTDGTSHVCIFSDSLEARIVAQDYARIIMNRLRDQALENGTSLPEGYTVPISFYLPHAKDNKNHLHFYSPAQQKLDKAKAVRYLQQKLANKPITLLPDDYYKLLALDDTSEVNKSLVGGTPLLLKLIQDGHFQLAESLLERDKEQGKNIPLDPKTWSTRTDHTSPFVGEVSLLEATIRAGAKKITQLLIEKGRFAEEWQQTNEFHLSSVAKNHGMSQELEALRQQLALQFNDLLDKRPTVSLDHMFLNAAHLGLDEMVKRILALKYRYPLNGLHQAIRASRLNTIKIIADYIKANEPIKNEVTRDKSNCLILLEYAILTGDFSLLLGVGEYTFQPHYSFDFILKSNMKLLLDEKNIESLRKLLSLNTRMSSGTLLRDKFIELALDFEGATALKAMLAAGLDVNGYYIIDGINQNLLIKAGDQINLLEIILQAGINQNHRDDALRNAIESKYSHSSIELLIKNGANINLESSYGNSLLFNALTKDLHAAKILIKNGAKLNAQDLKTECILWLCECIETGKKEDLLNFVLEECLDDPTRKIFLQLMLYKAVTRGNLPMVNSSITKGADINYPIEKEQDLLLTAIQWGSYSIARSLIENNIKINRIPIAGLCYLNPPNEDTIFVMKHLIINGADFETSYNIKPIAYAAKHGLTEIVDLLINRKADINTKNDDQTPLSIAATSGHIEVVKSLLRHDAQFDEGLIQKVRDPKIRILLKLSEFINKSTRRSSFGSLWASISNMSFFSRAATPEELASAVDLFKELLKPDPKLNSAEQSSSREDFETGRLGDLYREARSVFR